MFFDAYPAQKHFGDTVLAVLDHLLKPGSALNTDTPWSPMNSVFYSLYDRIYISYSMRTADLLCVGSLVAFVALFFARTEKIHRGVLLRYILNKGQSWFTHEQLPLVVFGLPVLSGKQVLFQKPLASR
jgi:hypothetical protein